MVSSRAFQSFSGNISSYTRPITTSLPSFCLSEAPPNVPHMPFSKRVRQAEGLPDGRDGGEHASAGDDMVPRQ
jgi:hypothetical protein